MLLRILCLFSLVPRVSSILDCLCDVHDVEKFIYRCPTNLDYPYATLHSHDFDYRPVRRKRDDFFSDVHCVPRVLNVKIQTPGWLAVEINGTIGFTEADEGIIKEKCHGLRRNHHNLVTTKPCQNVVLPNQNSTSVSASTTLKASTKSTVIPTTLPVRVSFTVPTIPKGVHRTHPSTKSVTTGRASFTATTKGAATITHSSIKVTLPGRINFTAPTIPPKCIARVHLPHPSSKSVTTGHVNLTAPTKGTATVTHSSTHLTLPGRINFTAPTIPPKGVHRTHPSTKSVTTGRASITATTTGAATITHSSIKVTLPGRINFTAPTIPPKGVHLPHPSSKSVTTGHVNLTAPTKGTATVTHSSTHLTLPGRINFTAPTIPPKGTAIVTHSSTHLTLPGRINFTAPTIPPKGQSTTPSTISTYKPKWITVRSSLISKWVTVNVTTNYNKPTTNTVKKNICDEIKIKNDMFKHKTIYHSKARQCPTGKGSKFESVAYGFCYAPDIGQWTRGNKVNSNCNTIPLYTPISPFYGNYLLGGEGVSVLTSCLPSGGFKVIRKTCNSEYLEEVEILPGQSGDVLSNPDSYYVIRW